MIYQYKAWVITLDETIFAKSEDHRSKCRRKNGKLNTGQHEIGKKIKPYITYNMIPAEDFLAMFSTAVSCTIMYMYAHES